MAPFNGFHKLRAGILDRDLNRNLIEESRAAIPTPSPRVVRKVGAVPRYGAPPGEIPATVSRTPTPPAPVKPPGMVLRGQSTVPMQGRTTGLPTEAITGPGETSIHEAILILKEVALYPDTPVLLSRAEIPTLVAAAQRLAIPRVPVAIVEDDGSVGESTVLQTMDYTDGLVMRFFPQTDVQYGNEDASFILPAVPRSAPYAPEMQEWQLDLKADELEALLGGDGSQTYRLTKDGRAPAAQNTVGEGVGHSGVGTGMQVIPQELLALGAAEEAYDLGEDIFSKLGAALQQYGPAMQAVQGIFKDTPLGQKLARYKVRLPGDLTALYKRGKLNLAEYRTAWDRLRRIKPNVPAAPPSAPEAAPEAQPSAGAGGKPEERDFFSRLLGK